jgi:hypothetical protein
VVGEYKNVTVGFSDCLRFAQKHNAKVVMRGPRAVSTSITSFSLRA